MKVIIDTLAEQRLWAFIRAKDVEVGGWGYAFIERDGSIHWRETFLVAQEVCSSEVDFEATGGDAQAVERAMKDGVLDEPNFLFASWHSHHKMTPFWSGTDNARIAAMRSVGVKRLLSFVGCHDGSYRMRLDVFDGEVHGIGFPQITEDELPLERESSEFDATIAAELDENVKEKKLTTTNGWLWTPAETLTTETLNGRRGSRTDELSEQEVLGELEFDGYSPTEARATLERLGVDGCWNLIDQNINGKVLEART